MKKLFIVAAFILSYFVVKAQNHVEFRQYGLYSFVDYSAAWNLNNDPEGLTDVSLSELTGVVGYQIRQHTGLGLGVTYFSESTNAYTQMPLFVEFRSHFTRHQLTPYTVLQLGYTIPIGHSSGGDEGITITKGGVFFGATIGARYAITRYFGLSLFAGYQMLMMNEVEYKHAALLTNRMPVQFHIVRAGLGINF